MEIDGIQPATLILGSCGYWGTFGGTAFNFHDKNSPSHYFPPSSEQVLQWAGVLYPRRRESQRLDMGARRKGPGPGIATAVGAVDWRWGKHGELGNQVDGKCFSAPWGKKRDFMRLKYILVCGLELYFYFSHHIGNNHPNWLAYFSEGYVYHQPENTNAELNWDKKMKWLLGTNIVCGVPWKDIH